MLQNPGYVSAMASSGMTVPTYAYAANNPLRYADPTGLYVIGGSCPGYERAREIARRKAGCDGAASQCRDKVLGAGGVDLCEMLKDGEGPILQPRVTPMYDRGTGNEALGRNSSIYWNGEAVVWQVDIAQRMCALGNEEWLASLMIHEAMHAAKFSRNSKPDPVVELLNQRYCQSCLPF